MTAPGAEDSRGGSGLCDVGVVFVEYRSGGLTARTAQTAADLGCVVVVADNSSTYRGVGSVVPMPANVGFATACNAAVRAMPAEVDTIVFWNPDARIHRQDLEALVRVVRHEGWDAVAPSLRTTSIRPHGFAYPSPAREAWVVVREIRGRRERRRERPGRSGDPARGSSSDGPREVPHRFGSAALLVVDRRAFEKVGGFDERYFLYVEDLDLWDRLRGAGFRCGFLSSVVASHASSAGSEASAVSRAVLRWLGVELFAVERSRWRWWSYRLIHGLAARWVDVEANDSVATIVQAGVAMGRSPDELQRDVRRVAATGAGRVVSLAPAKLGWSRTRVILRSDDRVLDVGSGAFPNPRADVLCEGSPHREHRDAIVDRPFVVADAQALPFRTGAFDFVIASHLAEHVDDPEALCGELDRVATAGYVETPSPLFERFFPEANHRWRVHAEAGSRLRFEANHRRDDLISRFGRRAYRWYYFGRGGGSTAGAGPVLRPILQRVAFIVRGTLNRVGVTVTRVRFGPGSRLSAIVRRESNDAA